MRIEAIVHSRAASPTLAAVQANIAPTPNENRGHCPLTSSVSRRCGECTSVSNTCRASPTLAAVQANIATTPNENRGHLSTHEQSLQHLPRCKQTSPQCPIRIEAIVHSRAASPTLAAVQANIAPTPNENRGHCPLTSSVSRRCGECTSVSNTCRGASKHRPNAQ
ncbi:unnamed protein product, partial [Iphiclides podalirius]